MVPTIKVYNRTGHSVCSDWLSTNWTIPFLVLEGEARVFECMGGEGEVPTPLSPCHTPTGQTPVDVYCTFSLFSRLDYPVRRMVTFTLVTPSASCMYPHSQSCRPTCLQLRHTRLSRSSQTAAWRALKAYSLARETFSLSEGMIINLVTLSNNIIIYTSLWPCHLAVSMSAVGLVPGLAKNP